jgi:acetyl-CoA acetyltransferase
MLGQQEVVLVVGVENMSQAPYYLARGENNMGDIKLVVSSIFEYIASKQQIIDSLDKFHNF